MPSRHRSRRRVCFVTGTRAEFGLMRSTLRAIQAHPRLDLQLIVTGMHLDARHGNSRSAIESEFTIDHVTPWPRENDNSSAPAASAANTGAAMLDLARAFDQLKPEVVLVTGDRVEPFAAASAAHLARIAVAHVHGGDRALGQVDDSLRHAITKLAHLHFPATAASARRILRLGEDPWRIHRVGSPGLDALHESAAPPEQVATLFPQFTPGCFALLVLHPIDPDVDAEHHRADLVLRATRAAGFPATLIIYPNNDPGSAGIIRRWRAAESEQRVRVLPDLPRPIYLSLLRDAAVLVGNSSSGIIEAATFGTPVLDIGPRQAGREHSANLVHCDYRAREIREVLQKIWNSGRPRRFRGKNIYGGAGAAQRMADILAAVELGTKLLTKLIRY